YLAPELPGVAAARRPPLGGVGRVRVGHARPRRPPRALGEAVDVGVLPDRRGGAPEAVLDGLQGETSRPRRPDRLVAGAPTLPAARRPLGQRRGGRARR